VQNGVSGNERCSGFLISPTAFVTAAHCFHPNGDPIRITFDANSLSPAATFIEVPASSVVAAPGGLDIAVITVPAQAGHMNVGSTSDLRSNDEVDVVGYGVSGIKAGNVFAFGTRQIASTQLANAGSLGDLYLKLLAGPGNVVAINYASNGNPNCNGVTYSLRLDSPGVQAFLSSYE
jgi:V8-like Glu-specific endopeptidase